MKGTLGKHWKVKDTSKLKGRQYSKGKHWIWSEAAKQKIKKPKSEITKQRMKNFQKNRPLMTEITKQKLKEMNLGSKNKHWKGGPAKANERAKLKVLKERENRAGRQKPKQCEVCGAIGKICFDHSHNTGKFRGWICLRCNLVLGLVKDDSILLRNLIKYLEEL